MHEAMSDDEELAEHLLSQAPEEKPPIRRWSEYSVVVELLTAIYDRLAEVPNAIAAANGAKPRKVKPAARPVTAMDRVRDRKAQYKHRSVVARVLPAGGDTGAFLREQERGQQRRRQRGLRSRAEPGNPLLS